MSEFEGQTFARTQFFSVCPQRNVPSRPPRMRRRSHLAPSAFGTETFSRQMIYSRGFARCEAFMSPLSASDVFLTVAIMSVTFLTEVGLFILIGML